jgi:hypothetical protein
MRRLLVSLLALPGWVVIAPAANAGPGCPPMGAPPPAGAAQRQVADLDGGDGAVRVRSAELA